MRKNQNCAPITKRSRFDSPWIGETLAPEACEILRTMGLDSVLQDVPAVAGPGTARVWASGEILESDYLFAVKGFARHLDRTAFDRTLSSAAAVTGAELKLGTKLRTCERHGDRWRGDFEHDGRTESFTTRWVLDATGRAGWLVNRLGIRPVRSDPLVAHVARLEQLSGDDARLRLEAVPGGWWYFAPLREGVRGCGLSHRSRIPRRSALREASVAGDPVVIFRMSPSCSRLQNVDRRVVRRRGDPFRAPA